MITQEQFNECLGIMFRCGCECGWEMKSPTLAYKEAIAEIKATVFSESDTPKKD